MAVTTLDAVDPGMVVVVVAIDGRGPGRRRLMDMGFLPGEAVEVIRRAPFGDPVEYRVKGSNLMVRGADASLVRVRAKDLSAPPRPIVMLRRGESARVVAIMAGRGLRRRLVELGLGEGAVVTGAGAGRGRVLVEVNGRSVPLGKGVAMKVMVELRGSADGEG